MTNTAPVEDGPSPEPLLRDRCAGDLTRFGQHDGATIGLGQLLGNGKPEPGAAEPAGIALERLEQPVAHGLRDARSGIGDRQLERFAVDLRRHPTGRAGGPSRPPPPTRGVRCASG